MISLLGNLVFFTLLLFLPVAGVTLALSLDHLVPVWTESRAEWMPFGIGFASMAVGWGLLLRRWGLYRFLVSLDHELLHVLAAILTGGKVLNMSVTSLGEGTVVVDRPNRLISMAPYWISLPLLCALAVAAVAPSELVQLGAGLLGAMFAYHLIRVGTTCLPGQPDFRQTTYPLGLVVVVLVNALLAGLVASVVTRQLEGGSAYLETLYESARSIPALAGITRS